MTVKLLCKGRRLWIKDFVLEHFRKFYVIWFYEDCMVAPVLYHWVYVEVYVITIDSTICTIESKLRLVITKFNRKFLSLKKNAHLTTIHFLHNISHRFSLRAKHADLWRLTISDQNVIFRIHTHPVGAQELSLSPVLTWANFQKEVSAWIEDLDTVVHVVADDDVVVEIHGAVER